MSNWSENSELRVRRGEAWRSWQDLGHRGPECQGRKPGVTLGILRYHCKVSTIFISGRFLLRAGQGVTEVRRMVRRLLPRFWRDMTVAWPR